MKRTLLLKTMLLLWALIVGSLSVWADETLVYTLDGSITTGGNSNYAQDGGGLTQNGMEWSVTANTTINPWRVGGKNLSNEDRKVYSKTAMGSSITKVELEVGSITLSSVNSIKLIVASDNAFESEIQTITKSDITANTTLTFTPSESEWATGAYYKFVFNVSAGGSNSYIQLKSAKFYKDDDTPTISDCDLALTPITLNFDLYNNSDAQVINYTTSSTGAVTIADNDYATFDIDETNKTITVTPTAVTPSAQTITVNQAVDDTHKAGSATFTITITDSTPIPTHTATFSVNGVTTSQNYEEGVAIAFPDDPADIGEKTFVGWTTTAINGTTNDAPDFVTSANMGNSDITFYAVFANESGSSSVVDELDYEWAGVSGTNYKDWSGKNATSSAVYAGNTAGGNESIQLRSSGSNSGIVSTTSGGKVAKVVVEWNSNTAAGRKIDIYGKNTPYSKADSLYNEKYQGTKLGSITTSQTELIVEGDYAYVGIRSYNGALYLDKVSITWSNGGGVSYSDYCTTVVAAAVAQPTIDVAANPFIISTTATTTCVTDGATIYYSYDNTNWTEYTETLTITEATTLYAKAMKDETESTVAYVTITKNLAAPTVTIDATSITNTDVFIGTEAGSLAASVTYNDANVEGATVTWSGNDDEVATIDASTGAVTLVAAGTVTFTATYAGNSDYAEKTATYEMTVTNSDPNAPGTENNPYKVSEITAVEDGVYVQGIISSITEVSTQYKNATYKISEDGTTTNEFTVFRGRYLDSADFTSEDQISVGDSVVIYGNIGTYQEQLQLNQNNYLVKLIRKAATPSITVAEFAIDAPAEGKDGTITVTYNNITDVASEVYFCDAEGNAATYEWVYAEINNSHNLDYVISENTTESARTAYLKVRALDDESNDVYSELITITQAKPVVMNTYTLATSVVPGRHYIIVGNYNSYKKAMASQNTNNRRTVDITLNDATASVESEAGAREILISVDENTGYFTLYDEVEEGYLYAACGTGTGNYLKTEKKLDDDGYGLWTISIDNDGIATIKATNGKRNWLRYNNGSEVFSCYASGQKDVYLYERDGDTGSQTVDVNIASACTDNEGYYYGTFSAPYSFIAPADITVSEIGIDEAGKLDVQAYGIEDVVPANTGVMISSTTSGSHTLTVVAGNGTSVMGDGNRLRATGNEGITATAMDEADPDCVFYRLTMHNKTDLGFYWGAAEGVAFDVVANKAYLAVPKSAGARIQGFSFEDGVITGIRNITPALSEGEGAIFDLQGRRVAKPVNGLYIVNGKKIVIK